VSRYADDKGNVYYVDESLMGGFRIFMTPDDRTRCGLDPLPGRGMPRFPTYEVAQDALDALAAQKGYRKLHQEDENG